MLSFIGFVTVVSALIIAVGVITGKVEVDFDIRRKN